MQCLACKKPTDRRCGGCDSAFYCNQVCADLHWPVHKAACLIAGKAKRGEEEEEEEDERKKRRAEIQDEDEEEEEEEEQDSSVDEEVRILQEEARRLQDYAAVLRENARMRRQEHRLRRQEEAQRKREEEEEEEEEEEDEEEARRRQEEYEASHIFLVRPGIAEPVAYFLPDLYRRTIVERDPTDAQTGQPFTPDEIDEIRETANTRFPLVIRITEVFPARISERSIRTSALLPFRSFFGLVLGDLRLTIEDIVVRLVHDHAVYEERFLASLDRAFENTTILETSWISNWNVEVVMRPGIEAWWMFLKAMSQRLSSQNVRVPEVFSVELEKARQEYLSAKLGTVQIQ